MGKKTKKACSRRARARAHDKGIASFVAYLKRCPDVKKRPLGSSSKRDQAVKEVEKWDRSRMTQGRSRARAPIYFVDPDTGDLIELDYRTATFRGSRR